MHVIQSRVVVVSAVQMCCALIESHTYNFIKWFCCVWVYRCVWRGVWGWGGVSVGGQSKGRRIEKEVSGGGCVCGCVCVGGGGGCVCVCVNEIICAL